LTYAHKAYFNIIIYSTEHARKSYLRAAGYFEDDIATLKYALKNNRTTLIKHVTPSSVINDTDTYIGEPVELLMKPYLDLLRQNKSLLGGCKLRLKFVPNRPEFLFMVNDTTIIPQIEFLDVYLEVPKAIVSDQILMAHNRALQESPAKYPIERVEVRSMTINAGVTGKPLENVINGVLPRRIYLYFLTNEAFNGSYETNPFILDISM
jgi:hypothetical protein